jgi:hypothetical protein
MENEDTRTLTLELPPTIAVKNAPDPAWTTITGGWRSTLAAPLNLFWKGTIDLSGYVREMKTFYPSAAFTQRGPISTEVAGAGLTTYTIISSIPLDEEQILLQLADAGGPGFLNGTTNWDTVLFAESQTWVVNANITPNPQGVLQLLDSHQSGSLSPTAADTLYCLKLVMPFATNQTQMLIPASRVIIPGKFGTEPDVEYMMRLKRSVELSQQV